MHLDPLYPNLSFEKSKTAFVCSADIFNEFNISVSIFTVFNNYSPKAK